MDKAIANILELASGNPIDSGYFYPELDNSSSKEKINLSAAFADKLWKESLEIAEI